MKDNGGSLDDALSRWSRRKADARRSAGKAGRRGRAAPQAAPDPDPLPAAGGASIETSRQDPAMPPAGGRGSDERANAPHDASRGVHGDAPGHDPDRPLDEAEARAMAEDLGLPPLEDLTAASDYRGFLEKGVPAALSRAALRTLWASDPVLANLDRLNEYDEDYRALNAAHETVTTAYRVGKGFLEPDSSPEDGPEVESVPAPSSQDAGEDGSFEGAADSEWRTAPAGDTPQETEIAVNGADLEADAEDAGEHDGSHPIADNGRS